MAVQAPSASHHHTALGIKGSTLAKIKLAQPLVSIRQNGFEDGKFKPNEGCTRAQCAKIISMFLQK